MRIYGPPFTPLRNHPRCAVSETMSQTVSTVARIAVVLPVSACARSRERSQTVSHSAKTTAQPSKRCKRRMPFRCCPSKAHRQARIPVAAVANTHHGGEKKIPGCDFSEIGLTKKARDKVKKCAAQIQRNRKGNQHLVLRMFRQQQRPSDQMDSP